MSHSASRLHVYRFPAFLLAAALLLAVGVAMVLSIRGVTRSGDLIKHTYLVMAAAEDVRSSTLSAESSARGYRLSGRSTLLAEYLASVPRVQSAADALVALISDNSARQQRARQLRVLVGERLDELQRLVDLQDIQGIQVAQRASVSSTGFELMQRIDALTEQMLAQERVLLDARRGGNAHQSDLMTGFVVIGIVLPLLMLGLLLAGLVGENRRVRALERETQQSMRELAQALEQRGRLSEQRRKLGAYAGLLQSCQSLEEAMEVTASLFIDMLPNAGGRCYVMRASQNLAETAAGFGSEAIPSDSLLQPDGCWGLRRGQPHRSGPGIGNVRCAHLHAEGVDGGAQDAWTLCVPLIAQGTSLGMLHLSGVGGGGDEDVVLVDSIAEQLSLAMVNLQLRESLRVQSLRDPLTGLYNRRYLEEGLKRELGRCERRGLPLSVLMLDVDHFKRFNDQHGHAAGDAMLASVAQTLQAMTRGEDIVCRYGGEEFTVVLPEADSAGAQSRAEVIRKAIAATTVLHLREQLGPNTVSIGIATFPADANSPHELLRLADAALYRAKAQGRDRYIAHEPALA